MKMQNIAFVDGQNLHMGTKSCDEPWEADLYKLKLYLFYKYKVTEVNYFIGYYQEHNEKIYTAIKSSGVNLYFRNHNENTYSIKKGNVDTDIIFEIMKQLYKNKIQGKIVLISGDGDYCKLVDFLILEKKFVKILFPNKKYFSSLYKKLSAKNFGFLEDVSHKIKKGP
jgi:uncharacterized LabA/DUF88 family protein